MFGVCTELMGALHEVPQPVIAAVQGVCGRRRLPAPWPPATWRSPRDTAVFGTPGVKIGLFCSTPMVAVSRAIGRKRAMQLLLTGETIDGADRRRLGAGERGRRARRTSTPGVSALAARIADASGSTLRIGKQAFYTPDRPARGRRVRADARDDGDQCDDL